MNNNNKSITFIISSLSGGGAERVLSNLANYFSKNNYKVDIVYSFVYKDNPSYEIDEKIIIHKLPSNIVLKSGTFLEGKKNTFLIIKHLRKKMNELNPDVVVSFMDKTNIYSTLAHLGLKMPLIISERISYDFLQSKVWRAIRKATYPFSDGMVVLSQYDYEKYSFVKDKKIIFNPIVFDDSLDVSFERKEKIILAVGRLDSQKGFDMLFESISKVDLKGWKLLVLGEGNERTKLEHQIDKLNLNDKVILKGRVEDVENYYNKASVFVLSSRYEGFPNALAEAMSFGCACIAFDCKTGPSDIIENDINGYLVKDFNIEILSNKIKQLINDETKRKEFFIESLKIREKLEIKNIAKEWEVYFEELCNK